MLCERAGRRGRASPSRLPPPSASQRRPKQKRVRTDALGAALCARGLVQSVDKESFAEEEGARAESRSRNICIRAGDRSAGSSAYCSAISRVIEVLGEGLVRARTKTPAF